MFPGDFTIKLRLEHRPPSVLDADVSARRMKLVRLHNLTPIPLAVFLEKEKNELEKLILLVQSSFALNLSFKFNIDSKLAGVVKAAQSNSV